MAREKEGRLMDAQLLQDMTALASKHADNADWQDLEKARLGVEEAFSALGRALDRAQARVAVLERALRAIADGIPYGGDNLKSDWSRNIAKAALANAAGYGAAIEAVKKLKEVRHGS